MPETDTPPKVTWRAGADRIAHAHVARHTRTLCGELVLEERLSWPAFRRCLVCRAKAEAAGVAA